MKIPTLNSAAQDNEQEVADANNGQSAPSTNFIANSVISQVARGMVSNPRGLNREVTIQLSEFMVAFLAPARQSQNILTTTPQTLFTTRPILSQQSVAAMTNSDSNLEEAKVIPDVSLETGLPRLV